MINVKVFIIALVYLRVTNAIELKCNFTMTKILYCCESQTLVVLNPQSIITEVSGRHLSDLKVADVEYLKIIDQNVKYLPINIAEYFPNLKRLKVSRSKLEYLTKNNFLGLTQLVIMYMGQNELKALPCGVFDTNRRLQEIHFENNSLTEIGADVFKPLLLLTKAHFRNNICIDKDLGNIYEVEELLNEITTKCFMNCDPTMVCSRMIKELENDLSEKEEEIKRLENIVKNISVINDKLRHRFCYKTGI